MTFPVHGASARRGFALVALLATLAPGCSKHPPAPEIPGPTRFLVFASDRNRASGSDRILYATFDGGGASTIAPRDTIGLVDRHPSLSQNGRYLCYQSRPGFAGSQDVLIYDRSAKQLIKDPNLTTAFDETEPQISLDGTKVAFVRDSLGTRHLRLYDLTTSTLIPLPNLEQGGFNDWSPSLDEHGQTIAFVSDRHGTPDVMIYRRYLAAVDDSSALRSDADDIEPGVSADGHYVAFASNRAGGAGGYDVYLYDLNANLVLSLPSLTNTPANEQEPSLSHDGSYMVFASDRLNGLGGEDLWYLNRFAAILSQPSGFSSAADDLDPYVVWP